MKFNNAKEMFDTVVERQRDLYCKEKELYVFLDNEVGSIAVYSIDKTEATKLRKQSEEHKDYWSAFLDVGGEIYDDPSYEEFDPDNQMSNMNWFEENYEGEWEDVTI